MNSTSAAIPGNPSTPEAQHYLSTVAEQVDERLERVLEQRGSAAGDQTDLIAAMRYSAIGAGKRLRAALVYAAAALAPRQLPTAILSDVAAAVECIHSYSLIHDDLPAMDDDDMRRGKPSCHIAFGEAVAILAGDALQVLAFEILVETASLKPEQRLQMIAVLAAASGHSGMAGGQALDLFHTDSSTAVSLAQLEQMHKAKTGALINASIQLGAICAEVPRALMEKLQRFGDCIGLAFQIRDDLLDIIGQPELLGKPVGSDSAAGKVTWPVITGEAAARQHTEELYHKALEALEEIPHPCRELRALAHYIVTREQ